MKRRQPGQIRDAILAAFAAAKAHSLKTGDIHKFVEERLGVVATSSVRSYLQLNVPGRFAKVGRGTWRLGEQK